MLEIFIFIAERHVFFFQAEDGIRDGHVTGVQTCALPISPEFQFMSTRHQLWVPISIERQNREYHYLTVVARLKAPRDRAALEMAVLARALEKEYPKSNKGWTIQVDDFQEWLIRRSFRTRLLLLFAALGLVLLIACTNVASLLLARASA